MNVVVILNDTLRADHVSAYGLPQPWDRPGHSGLPFIDTPNLDALATESVVFNRYYTGSYPTIPARYDLFVGRTGFATRGWQPLQPDDLPFAEWLSDYNCTTALVFDTPALANDEYNFTRGFTGWEWVRGQHRDRWVTDPIVPALPAAAYKLHNVAGLRNYQLNARRRIHERDWMCAKTAGAATDWLEHNRTRDRFVLWVDMWDPHEPFDAPPYDLARYRDPQYHGDFVSYPRYGRTDYLTAAELNDIRAIYAAKVTLVDRWVGQLLNRIDVLGLRDNTLVVFLSDHGHLFGEHNLLGKPTGQLGMLYEPSIRIPLMMRPPGGQRSGARIHALAQPCDVLPTILEFLKIPAPETLTGTSLWPVIEGGTPGREYAFSGRFSRQTSFERGGRRAHAAAMAFDGWVGIDGISEPLTVTTEEWTLVCRPAGTKPRELYHLTDDPFQSRNVFAEHPREAERLNQALLDFLRANGAPPERVRAYDWAAGPPAGLGAASLDASTPCWAIRQEGKLLAFLSPGEAQAAAPGPKTDAELRQTTLEALCEGQPRALVCIGDQYFLAEDVPLGSRRGD